MQASRPRSSRDWRPSLSHHRRRRAPPEQTGRPLPPTPRGRRPLPTMPGTNARARRLQHFSCAGHRPPSICFRDRRSRRWTRSSRCCGTGREIQAQIRRRRHRELELKLELNRPQQGGIRPTPRPGPRVRRLDPQKQRTGEVWHRPSARGDASAAPTWCSPTWRRLSPAIGIQTRRESFKLFFYVCCLSLFMCMYIGAGKNGEGGGEEAWC